MNKRVEGLLEKETPCLVPREGHGGISCHERVGLCYCQLLSLLDKVGREAKAEAYEEAAVEALEPRNMFLTHENIKDGMLRDDHPVIVARAIMRKEISKVLHEKAAALRAGGKKP